MRKNELILGYNKNKLTHKQRKKTPTGNVVKYSMVKYLNLSFNLRNETKMSIISISFSSELEILVSIINKARRKNKALTIGNKENYHCSQMTYHVLNNIQRNPKLLELLMN